jgi:hypothetical protein
VKEALLGCAIGIGAENDLPGKSGRAGQRMNVQVNGIFNASESDGFADGCVDDARMPDDGYGMAADAVEIVESPYLGTGLLAEQGSGKGSYYPKSLQHGFDDSAFQRFVSQMVGTGFCL